jgi:putative oxidoreductase
MNWFGNAPAGQEGFEYHLVVIVLCAVVVIAGGGAFSVDRRLAVTAGRAG